jgi:hypothetical protein
MNFCTAVVVIIADKANKIRIVEPADNIDSAEEITKAMAAVTQKHQKNICLGQPLAGANGMRCTKVRQFVGVRQPNMVCCIQRAVPRELWYCGGGQSVTGVVSGISNRLLYCCADTKDVHLPPYLVRSVRVHKQCRLPTICRI